METGDPRVDAFLRLVSGAVLVAGVLEFGWAFLMRTSQEASDA